MYFYSSDNGTVEVNYTLSDTPKSHSPVGLIVSSNGVSKIVSYWMKHESLNLLVQHTMYLCYILESILLYNNII